jgi:hypothetical protein
MLRLIWTLIKRTASSRLGLLLMVLSWCFVWLVFVELPVHRPQFVGCVPRGDEVYEVVNILRAYKIWIAIPAVTYAPSMLFTSAVIPSLQSLFSLSCIPTARLEMLVFVIASSIQWMLVGRGIESYVQWIARIFKSRTQQIVGPERG